MGSTANRPVDWTDSLLQSGVPDTGGCQNASEDFQWGLGRPPGIRGDSLCIRVRNFCLDSRISNCPNKSCVILRQAVYAIDDFKWQGLRAWVATVAACHTNQRHLKNSMHGELSHILKIGVGFSRNLSWILGTYTATNLSDVEFEVFELFNWLDGVINPSLRHKGWYDHVSYQSTLDATKVASDLGICENRLWSLVKAGQNEKCLSALFQLTFDGITGNQIEAFQHVNHHSCCAEYCCFSDIDSTYVQQLHKCAGRNCSMPLRFYLGHAEAGPMKVWWFDTDGEDPYSSTS